MKSMCGMHHESIESDNVCLLPFKVYVPDIDRPAGTCVLNALNTRISWPLLSQLASNSIHQPTSIIQNCSISLCVGELDFIVI